MLSLKNFKHYNDILWLLYKYGRIDLFKEFNQDLPPGLKEKSHEWGKAKDLAEDLEKLGPFYIKLGQILSSEAQIIPPEYEEALQGLQDNATPMPYEDIEETILLELGGLPEQIFRRFCKEPLSAASLGQVHLAELPNKVKVAVKVQRKNIQEDLFQLLEALENICHFLQEKTAWGNKYHIIEKFQTLRTVLLNELDYKKEGDNLKHLHQNLKEFKHLIVPLPVDDLTTSKVLTMDYVKGKKLTELPARRKIHAETTDLASELFKSFLQQIFIDGFFQMDPHPGNIYLTEVKGVSSLAIFDMGMVAYVPFHMQGQLLRCLLAMSEIRELEVTKIMISLGKRLPNFDEYFLRTKVGDLIGQYHNVTLSQTPIGRLVLKLSSIAAESGLWLPIQFSTIGKALLSLDPVLKALNPDFKPNAVLHNHAVEILNKKLSNQFSTQSLYSSLFEVLEFVQQLPSRLTEIFDLFSHNEFQMKINLLESHAIAKNFEKIANRITLGLILAALVVAAALLMRIQTPFQIFGYPGFAMVLFLLAAIGAFGLIISILWNDREKKP